MTEGYFEWNESLVVGVKVFDEQHKVFIRIINSIINAIERSDAMTLRQKFTDLIDYASAHFKHEEKYMQADRFPGLEAHAAEHAELMASVEKFRDRLVRGEKIEFDAARDFMIAWIVDHIVNCDQAYTEHFHSLGIN